MNGEKQDLRQVCLSEEARQALTDAIKSRLPSFPDAIRPYQWEAITQVDIRTVRRMLTAGTPVRSASVLAVFADFHLDFDRERHLQAGSAPETEPRDAAEPDQQAEPFRVATAIAEHDAAMAPHAEGVGPLIPARPRSPWIAGMAAAAVIVLAVAAVIVIMSIAHRHDHRISPENAAVTRSEESLAVRSMVMYDDFTRESDLDPKHWAANGQAVSDSLGHILGTQASLVTPDLVLDSQGGLGMTGVGDNNQQMGIQTQQAFSPPFTVTTEALATQLHADPLELAIVSGDGGSGIGIIGGQGVSDADTGFLYASAQGSRSAPWAIRGHLSPIAPDESVWYTLAIQVDARGMATVAASSDGHILGQATGQVGPGPFYVTLGQGAGAQQPAGPNQAYWQAFQVIHG